MAANNLSNLRAKAEKSGMKSLEDLELFSLIIRAEADSEAFMSLMETVETNPHEILFHLKGIGRAQAASLSASFELANRIYRHNRCKSQIKSPVDAYHCIVPMIGPLKQECFTAMLLDTKNHVISVETISLGSLNSSIVNSREVFRMAIVKSAHSIIAAHNHPSQDPTPSKEDEAVTERLNMAGDVIGIKVRDHLVVCKGSFYSFAEGKATYMGETW